MALANSTVVKDEPTTENRARAAIEAYTAKFAERISPAPIPVCKGRHLDVDGILARSLPKALGK